MKEYQNISHGFGPVYNRESRILILGSFPSVKSREQAFFYGHPRNRFWKVLAAVLKEDEPETVEEKKEMLLRHGVAVYDVIEQCSIIGSSDSSIKDVIPANLGIIVEASQIRKVYTNGKTAGKLYRKYQDKDGNNRTASEVLANNVQFADFGKRENKQNADIDPNNEPLQNFSNNLSSQQDFSQITNSDDDLPF